MKRVTMKQWKGMPLIWLVNHAYLKKLLELVNKKNCLTHWKQISKHIFQFLFLLFFFQNFGQTLKYVKMISHDLNFLKDNNNQSWICVGFIRLVLWPRLRVWKQIWILKNPKRCDGILEQRSFNNVASKIHLPLMCSPFLYFFF